MSSPLISVIIPHYNHARVLERALESIFGQTFLKCHPEEPRDEGSWETTFHKDSSLRNVGVRNDSLEIILVDDGSDEAQKEHLRQEIMPRFSPVKFIFSEHKGASAARNRGFSESAGQYVIFWDADIVGWPDMLAKMKKTLDQHPEASYAYSSFKFGWKKFICGPFDAQKLRRVNFITTTSLIRREHFSGFDESLKKFQDWDLWLTILAQGHVGVWVPEVLFQIINTQGAMSQWLPSLAYKISWKRLGWQPAAISRYEKAMAVIKAKHGLGG